MDYSYLSVELSQINLLDETFRISTKGLIPDTYGKTNKKAGHSLADSIKRIGIIHPPHLIRNAGKYQVVCGFERIMACRKLGWHTIPSFCLSPDLPSSERALISIAEAVNQHRLNMVEKAQIVRLITVSFPTLEEGLDSVRKVGFDLNAQMAGKLLKVNDFNQFLRIGLILERIGLPTAFRINQITEKSDTDCLALSEFMLLLNVSLTRQKEILDYIETICRRDDVSIVDLIKGKDVKGLIDNDKLDGPQKSNKILELLKKRCYPTLTQFEKHYQNTVKKVDFGQGVSFSPPPQFEGQNFSLRINFSSGDDLRQKVQDIDKLIDFPGFQDLISPHYLNDE